jgi:hypothetical protein
MKRACSMLEACDVIGTTLIQDTMSRPQNSLLESRKCENGKAYLESVVSTTP